MGGSGRVDNRGLTQGVVTVELMGRLRGSWQSRAHTGRNQVSQDYKVELMYRFDVDQQKTR